MCNEIELRDVSHRYSPLFEVIVEVINRLLWCELVLFVVLWSTAATHTNYIDHDELESFDKWTNALVEKCTRTSISMSVDKFRLFISSTNDGSDSNVFFIVFTNLDVFNDNLG
jgi:hypothetical protein